MLLFHVTLNFKLEDLAEKDRNKTIVINNLSQELSHTKFEVHALRKELEALKMIKVYLFDFAQ